MSVEDHLVEEHFENTHSRDDEGRYVVRLPFKLDQRTLGESQAIAQKRFHLLERKLNSDDILKTQYVAFMREYIQLGHMRKVNGDIRPSFYLPHHPVIKQSSLTTKMRVVFDGSAKTSSNISLNEILHTGPVVQDDLFSILIRFRLHRYVLSADVTKMYRQIKVHPSDTCYQRILWRENVDDKLATFELNTVTYGTTPAAYLATKSLHHLAETYKSSFPEAASIIQADFYVDDLLTGSDSIEHATLIASQISHILEQGGFELRKWSSNNERILKNITSSHRSDIKFLTINREPSNKILGLQWDINQDKLRYQEILSKDRLCPTKRSITSIIASIYDPVGLVAPVIIKAKCLIQTLWQLHVDWDETLPMSITSEWANIRNDLHSLQHVTINRFVGGVGECRIELHGFCDASSIAYGANIYVLAISKNGRRTSELLCSKSRVAPLLTTTIPRLELSAAFLLAKLMKATMKALKNPNIQRYYWTDSTIVLCWLRTNSRTLKTFVANRIAKIQASTSIENWQHVGTKDNPADLLSRGSTSEEIINNHLWWHGPNWLVKDEVAWPKIPENIPTIPLESKILTIIAQPNPDEILARFSNLNKLLRVLNVCFRFATPKNARKLGPASASEIRDSLNRTIKVTQILHFPKEYNALEGSEPINPKSCLLSLRPFLGKDGLIRIGGRISNSGLAFETQHQVILPRSSHLSRLIIEDQHRKTLHGGVASTLAAIRCQYWILGGRNTVKHIIQKCISCFKVRPTTGQHIMGDLPAARVTPSKPFSQTGIDFAGPIMVRELNKRSKKTSKMYIAVFICFATKAIHLEHVADLTSEACLAALRRFIARRGRVDAFWSDNATNFVGANKELKDLHSIFTRQADSNPVLRELAIRTIEWKFIPARAPHFGGLWEAAVKSMKRHLKTVTGNSLLTIEELITLLAQIEAILNSRPLTALTSDPEDFRALTPAHFLLGEALLEVPQPNIMDVKVNRLSRWQYVERLRQDLWTRWQKDYLTTLQPRSIWKREYAKLAKVGHLVLLKDNQTPPLQWIMARITELHPGKDGVLRAITVKLPSGSFVRRAIRNVCILPLED